MLTREQKSLEVQKISKQFSKSKASFLVNCIGMTAPQMADFRKALQSKNSEIKVVRNTLVRLSLKEHPDLEKAYLENLQKENAVVFVFDDDVTSVAKLLYDRKEEEDILDLKCGYFNGTLLKSSDIHKLAKLPSIKVLQSKFLQVLQAPSTQCVRLFKQVQENFVRVLQSYHDTKK